MAHVHRLLPVAAACAIVGLALLVALPEPGTLRVMPLRVVGGIATLETESPDLDALRDADRQAGREGPLRFAVAGETSVDLLSLPAEPIAGGLAYRLHVVSPGARSIGVALTTYRLPAGATVRLVGSGETLGPYDARDATGPGELWPPALAGEGLVVELVVPHAAAFAPEIVLGRVHHGYRDIGALPPAAGREDASDGCYVDTACNDDPILEGPIRSVALYTIQGTHVCTGQLLDSATPTPSPYLLTADHCGVTSTNAHTVRVYWNVVSPACGLRCCGDRSLSQAGAIVRAHHPATDTCLLELLTPPPAAANVFYSGWDARESTRPTTTTGIHHPSGGEKAISVNTDPPILATYLVGSGGDGTHWCVDGWEQGSTAPGSSGSGLWDENGRLVGQLHGGYAACGNTAPDWYGRLARAWDGGGSPGSRLSDWLDPGGVTGRVRDGRSLGGTSGVPPVAVTPPPPGRLLAPIPNPLRERARVRWTLEAPGDVEVDVFDSAGRHLARLAGGHADPGEYEAVWTGVRTDGRRMPPGVYVIRLRHDGHVVSGTKVVIER